MRKLSLEELNRISVDEFKTKDKTPIVLVLDNVRSGLNVGSAFRTADGFALSGIHLCGITGKPPHREILKTAIGATDAVDWQYFENTADSIATLKSDGFKIIAVEQAEGSAMLQEFTVGPEDKLALIFGNEVRGVGEGLMDKVDACIEIPQFGTKHSFNISVSVGIVVWELFRKMRF